MNITASYSCKRYEKIKIRSKRETISYNNTTERKMRRMTRGEVLAHQNSQCTWLPLHRKSLENSFFFMTDTIKSWVELHLWREMEKAEENINPAYITKIQCCFLLARLEAGFVSGDWHITYIFPLARKKLVLGLFFYFISLEGKTQQQQCGLELQLMNSNHFCSPQNSWRGQWNHKLHGAHPFLNAAFFEPEANCPIAYQSDIYLIYY